MKIIININTKQYAYTYGNVKELLVISVIDLNSAEIISIKCTANFLDVINFPHCCKNDILHAKSNIHTYTKRKIESCWRKAHIS